MANGASVLILNVRHQGHEHGHHHDHNLRSAYLHVLADMLTSVLAILALLAGRFLGAVWMDPLMRIVGAVLVAHWPWGPTRQSSGVLLDLQGPIPLRWSISDALESDGETTVTDLHVWCIGPGVRAAAVAVVRPRPVSAEYCKKLIADLDLAQVTVEFNSSCHKVDSHQRSD
ncbi:MAG: cation transporter [Planctomycetota bacterium]